MPFKLVVVNTAEEADGTPDVFVYNQDRVTIGRDASNDLALTDFKRIVSKEHAEIVRSGSTFRVIDLGSKNFTYLNGERLKSNQPHNAQAGDVIRIGQFELTLEVTEAPPEPSYGHAPDADRTVFDASFQNPFEDGAQLLGVALRDLGKNYAREAPARRDDALQDAIRESLDDQGEAALDAILRIFGNGAAAASGAEPHQPPPAPTYEPHRPPAYEPPSYQPPAEAATTYEPPAPDRLSTPSRTHSSASSSLPGSAPQVDRVLDVALRALARLIGVPWRFRHEFIGQTIMQADETAFLYEGDPDLLRRRLLDPDSETAARRLSLLDEAAEDVALHQLALLDGYKAAVRDGAHALIDQLHPEAIVEEVKKQNALAKLLPPLAKAQALERLRDQLKELRGEDWAAAERRTYRPAFIKAYLARMTSRRHSDEG